MPSCHAFSFWVFFLLPYLIAWILAESLFDGTTYLKPPFKLVDWLLSLGERSVAMLRVFVVLICLGDSILLGGDVIGLGENPSTDLVTSSERTSSPNNRLNSSFAFKTANYSFNSPYISSSNSSITTYKALFRAPNIFNSVFSMLRVWKLGDNFW